MTSRLVMDGGDPTPLLRIEGLSRRFGSFVALDGVDLAIGRGEFFALLGASGSGKSTLLRCLAGLDRPDGGRIVLDGQDIGAVPAHARPVNMMFQSYALFPHMTVAQNIGFGLRQEGAPAARIHDRVAEMLALVRLEGFGARRPQALSGGQRARVALARALAKAPKLLLLDEPLSALDRNLRQAMQFELVNIQKRSGTTFIIVTHDQEEALTMATRLAVMDRGAIVQVGTPDEVYEHPNSRLSAEFLGGANILPGHLDAAGRHMANPDAPVGIVAEDWRGATPDAPLQVAVRPERMRVLPLGDAAPAENTLVGTVREIAYAGDRFTIHVALPSGAVLRVVVPPAEWRSFERGAPVTVAWDGRATLVLAR